MANWSALRWSETVRTGNPSARHVLTMYCLKSDDSGVTYRDAAGMADLCEMTTRTLKTWRDYLATHGYLLVIRRMRRNGREAKPLTIVSYPEAPHLNGQAVRLDYHGQHMYPKDPEALRAAGVEWIAAESPGAVHPSADFALGPGVNVAPGMTSNDSEPPQVEPSANLASGPRAKFAPHGGGKICTPKAVPVGGNQPTRDAAGGTQAAVRASVPDVGWLVGEHDSNNTEDTPVQAVEAHTPVHPPHTAPNTEQPNLSLSEPETGTHSGTQPPNTEGAALLRRIGITGQGLTDWTPTVDRALTTFGRKAVTVQLSDPSGQVRNLPAACITTRLPVLAAQLDHATSSRAARNTSDRPAWCGQCEDWNRMLDGADGRMHRCPDCHPANAQRAA